MMNFIIDNLSKISTKNLVKIFILTGKIDDPEIPAVRGWIMDELEKRDPEAFDSWIGQDESEDEDLMKFFHAE